MTTENEIEKIHYQQILDKLQEECCEIGVEISKIRDWGLDSINPFEPEKGTNRERLKREIGDFLGMMTILVEQTDIGFNNDDLLEAADKKITKYFNWYADKIKKHER
jgi:NTP pyrophosphatase (non-canonical NTP hydrolase)